MLTNKRPFVRADAGYLQNAFTPSHKTKPIKTKFSIFGTLANAALATEGRYYQSVTKIIMSSGVVEGEDSIPRQPKALSTFAQSDDDDGKFSFALITPTSSDVPTFQTVTPDLPSSPSSGQITDDWNMKALEHARWDAEQSAQALEHLLNGMRAVRRMLEKTTADEYEHQQHSSTEELQQIHELSESLGGRLRSDFLALVNAADMIREHAKLAFKESSDLVTDLNQSRLQAQASELQAKQARKLARKLYKENLELNGQVTRLRRERRVLVSEVKNLREEAAETRKFDSWRLLEQHLLGSMAIHEMVMKTPSSSPKNFFGREGRGDLRSSTPSPVDKAAGTDANGSSPTSTIPRTEQSRPRGSTLGGRLSGIRGAFRYRKGSQCDLEIDAEEREVSNGGGGLENDKRSGLRPKSPIPSLGEASSFTDDSDTKTIKTENVSAHSLVQSEMNKNVDDQIPPTNVAFNTRCPDESASTDLTSPLVSPDGSPDGVVVPEYRPICDPDILRTLAIPNTGHPLLVSPRKRVSESLYEC